MIVVNFSTATIFLLLDCSAVGYKRRDRAVTVQKILLFWATLYHVGSFRDDGMCREYEETGWNCRKTVDTDLSVIMSLSEQLFFATGGDCFIGIRAGKMGDTMKN